MYPKCLSLLYLQILIPYLVAKKITRLVKSNRTLVGRFFSPRGGGCCTKIFTLAYRHHQDWSFVLSIEAWSIENRKNNPSLILFISRPSDPVDFKFFTSDGFWTFSTGAQWKNIKMIAFKNYRGCWTFYQGSPLVKSSTGDFPAEIFIIRVDATGALSQDV